MYIALAIIWTGIITILILSNNEKKNAENKMKAKSANEFIEEFSRTLGKNPEADMFARDIKTIIDGVMY